MALEFDKNVFRLELKTQLPIDLDLTNDGSLIAVAHAPQGYTAPIQVFRTKDGSVAGEFGEGAYAGIGVAFSGNGQDLFCLTQDEPGDFQFFRVSMKEKYPAILAGYASREKCHSLLRDQSGQYVAVLSNAVEIWDTDRQEVVWFREGASPDKPVHASFPKGSLHLYIYGTTEGFVVGYDLVNQQEIGRWSAPAAFGKQVLVSPSEEWLLLVGEGKKGVFLYHLTDGKRFLDDIFNEGELTELYISSPDSTVLLYFSIVPTGITLPSGDFIEGPRLRASPTQVVASAWEASITAVAKEKDLYWLQLVEE
jgi:hypothetical protein